MLTDSSGGDIRTMKYYPYGAERSSTGDVLTDKLFTGQQREPEGVSALGLYNYGARFYSTLTGRFLSPDPLIASPGDPQTLNRYSYVRNNPLRLVDPTGLTPEEDKANCEAHPSECVTWALASIGISTASDKGVVIVMGATHTEGAIDRYKGYGMEFLERYVPGCTGHADECWSGVEYLMRAEHGGASAVYDVFGIRFIMSDPGGRFGGGIGLSLPGVDRIPGVTTPEEALKNIIENPRGRTLIGVIGHSLGGKIVASVFLQHAEDSRYLEVPFFLDSPFDANPFAAKLPNFAGSFGFWSCKECSSLNVTLPGGKDVEIPWLPHGPRDRYAAHVFYCLDAISITHVKGQGC